MNKNAIQKYAIWARNELIEQVKQRAYQYGINDKGYGDENASVIAGRVLSADEKRQRREFVAQIKVNGYQQAVEEVAYTWFNRFVALRYMEVNDYLPTHVRVFSDVSGGFNPEILKDVLHLDLDGLDKTKVSELLNANQTEELYRYLLLTQCNALNEALPEMFEKLGSYTEMLLPNNILKQDSVLARLVKDIDEDDWKDQVQIIGWLYQYYITEKHDQIVNIYKGTVKKEDIPAATQLFTTDWVVRYMVDNSLGRYWIERHPESKLREKLRYFVVPKSGEIHYVSESITPQELTFFDPCMGSGHILVYAFDVLMEIYKECGYGERDAAIEIVKNNIFGLDIDERCSQLAYFAVMMKARSYDRRFLSRNIKPHVLSIKESNTLGSFTHAKLMPDAEQNKIGEYLVDVFRHAKEIGSLKTVENKDYEVFKQYLKRCEEKAAIDIDFSLWQMNVKPLMEHLADQARILSSKYTVVCTNPPYLGKMEGKLKDFVITKYKPYSSDLFSVFIHHNLFFCKANGFCGYMTPNVWMYLKSYEKLRYEIITTKGISSFIHLAKGSFYSEATVDICAFIISNKSATVETTYFKLDAYANDMESQGNAFLSVNGEQTTDAYYSVNAKNLLRIPGYPLSFWATENIIRAFENYPNLGSVANPCQGLASTNNDMFLRLWHEVQYCKVNFNCQSEDDTYGQYKWFPINKGGEYRKWYGNNEYLINFQNKGAELCEYIDQHSAVNHTGRVINREKYFKPNGTWSAITSSNLSVRYSPKGYIISNAGMAVYSPDSLKYIIAFLNSKMTTKVLIKVINESLNFNAGDIVRLPIIIKSKEKVTAIADKCIEISMCDWNATETSWDFRRHPLVAKTLKAGGGSIPASGLISQSFATWSAICEDRFAQLKGNEEELNRIFIDIYGLQDELTPEVEDKDVTVRPADLKREIRSLISYALGCMFGRYSLDVEGLTYAGGDWDNSKYKTYIPDKDNILPICDDEYFDDDILGRFVDFVSVVYGAETLEENLRFIAEALGGKGTPREIIRNYFLNDFYKDHCKIYQKRPIYWLFDSGKKNGFKALIYLHRYSRDLIAKLRTDYVHEQQERYRTQLSHIAAALNTATGSERARLLKQQDKLSEQLKEITAFEEKVHHLADQNIEIDLDDGVKKNYEIFTDVLAKI